MAAAALPACGSAFTLSGSITSSLSDAEGRRSAGDTTSIGRRGMPRRSATAAASIAGSAITRRAARACAAGFDQARQTISGPMPAGSPQVMATTGTTRSVGLEGGVMVSLVSPSL